MRALDLFCGAGGASMGLHRAGFDVVGVDIKPQPRYPFTFVQADAMRPPFDLSRFDFIWASPPCKAFTLTGWSFHFQYHNAHADLLTPMRLMLEKSGVPWAMENVPGAPIRDAVMLCGSMFGLGVRRHRLFETSYNTGALLPPCDHSLRVASPHGHPRKAGEGATWGPAMAIDWMSVAELSQAIPPAYSEFIARQFLQQRIAA